jgi:hypothetical protein
MLTLSRPEEAKRLMALAQHDVDEKWRRLEQMASSPGPPPGAGPPGGSPKQGVAPPSAPAAATTGGGRNGS